MSDLDVLMAEEIEVAIHAADLELEVRASLGGVRRCGKPMDDVERGRASFGGRLDPSSPKEARRE